MMAISESEGVPRKTGSRPKIPAEVERAVLIQAGHRCAVCGDPCPLERAHIIPWRISKQHKAEDLILLCANCHQRADLENWGEKTLREYKREPWIVRKHSDSLSKKNTQRLKITLGLELLDFDATHQRLLVYAIAAFLNISPEEVVITTIEEGSVKVTIQIPAREARKLLAAFEAKNSTLFDLLSHSFPIGAAVVRQEPADRGSRPASVDVGFEDFLKIVAPRIKQILDHYHIPVEDREDIVQQALLALLYQWERVREPESWVLGTLRRHCLIYWRIRRNDKPEAIEDPSNQKAEGQRDSEEHLLIIPPPKKEVLQYLRRMARGIAGAPNADLAADG